VDKLSRHRGAKLRTQFVLPGAISLLSLA
jgi:hypothetical protein